MNRLENSLTLIQYTCLFARLVCISCKSGAGAVMATIIQLRGKLTIFINCIIFEKNVLCLLILSLKSNQILITNCFKYNKIRQQWFGLLKYAFVQVQIL